MKLVFLAPQTSISSTSSISNLINYCKLSLYILKKSIIHIPVIKYLSTEIIYPLFKNHLPESLQNLQQDIQYLNIIDDKPKLIGTYFAISHIEATLISFQYSKNIAAKFFISYLANTANYAARTFTANYLIEQLTKDTDTPVMQSAKCGTIIVANVISTVSACQGMKLISPDALCSITNNGLMISGSISCAECYEAYKSLENHTKISATSDRIIPSLADIAILSISLNNIDFGIGQKFSSFNIMNNINQVMELMTKVVVTDYVSKMTMNLAPQDFKETYIELGFEYLYESVVEITGDLQEFFTSNNEL